MNEFEKIVDNPFTYIVACLIISLFGFSLGLLIGLV